MVGLQSEQEQLDEARDSYRAHRQAVTLSLCQEGLSGRSVRMAAKLVREQRRTPGVREQMKWREESAP